MDGRKRKATDGGGAAREAGGGGGAGRGDGQASVKQHIGPKWKPFHDQLQVRPLLRVHETLSECRL